MIVYFEPVVCICCVICIAFPNFKLIGEASSDLLDRTLDENMQMQILKCFSKIYPRISDFQGIRTRRSGHVIYIDLLVSFGDDTPYAEIYKAYEIFDKEIKVIIPNSVSAVVIGEGRSI